jgi:hypothetical protein
MSWSQDKMKLLLVLLALAGSGLSWLGAAAYNDLRERVAAVEKDHEILIEVRTDVKWLRENAGK